MKTSKPTKFKTPMAYIMAVINDPDVSAERRDHMALQAAPYFHAKVVTTRTYDYVTKKQTVESAAAKTAAKAKNGDASDLEFRVPNNAENTSALYSG